ncbi:MAG TPA: L-threonylcarbamoyladenylate synthase [Gemmatimonadales bacterium]|nr:L-threonylcarbamoyladenylate synthase [Gemmatimonadales bacterium]
MTVILRVNSLAPEPEALRTAADILRAGGLVAFPTETVYGLGAHALDHEAVARIFAAKGRPATNPLIVHVPNADAAQALTSRWPARAERLASRFWPGPLTLVLPKSPRVPDSVTASLPSVALRIPSHPIALALLNEAGIPVAAPSANRFTQLSPTTAAHVETSLGSAVDLILDGGPTNVGIESTVVDLTGEHPLLLRPGAVTREELATALGTAVLDPAVAPADNAPRLSPGMHALHYAPRAMLFVFSAGSRRQAEVNARDEVASEGRVGALLLASSDRFAAPLHRRITMPADATSYARELYLRLHELDDAGCTLIIVESPPAGGEWEGIHDRLRRASSTPGSAH